MRSRIKSGSRLDLLARDSLTHVCVSHTCPQLSKGNRHVRLCECYECESQCAFIRSLVIVFARISGTSNVKISSEITSIDVVF